MSSPKKPEPAPGGAPDRLGSSGTSAQTPPGDTPDRPGPGGAPDLAEPLSAQKPPKPSLGRRLWRLTRITVRWLRRIVLVLLLAILGLLAWVLTTTSGLNFALQRGLALYNGMIAGEVRLAGVRGSLLDDFTLEGLEARDAQGQVCLRLGALRLDWTVAAAALQGEVPVHALSVADLWVDLGPAQDGAPLFDALPPPSNKPPPPPAEGPLRLPVDLEAAVALRNVRVVAGAVTVAQLGALDLMAYATTPQDPTGALSLPTALLVDVRRLSAAAPPQDLTLTDLRLSASLDDVGVELWGLALDSNVAQLALPRARLDFDDLRTDFALDLVGRAEAINALAGDRLPQPLREDVQLTLRGGGILDSLNLGLSLDAGEGLRVELALSGALQPAPKAELEVRLVRVDPQAILPEDLHKEVAGLKVAGLVRAQIEGPVTRLEDLAQLDPRRLAGHVSVQCPACQLPVIGGLDAQIEARYAQGAAQVEAALRTLGIDVDVQAQLADALDIEASTLGAQWRIHSADLGPAARLVGQTVRGSLRTEGRCTGDLAALRCQGDVQLAQIALPAEKIALDRLDVHLDELLPLSDPLRARGRVVLANARLPGAPHPVSATVELDGSLVSSALTLQARHGPDRVNLALSVQPGPPLRVQLRRLDGRAEGLDLRLAKPVRVQIDEQQRIDLSPLVLEILGGSVEVAGRIDLQGHNDVRVKLQGLNLERLARYVPDLLGALDLNLHVLGGLHTPKIALDMQLLGAGWQGNRVGDVQLKSAVGGGQVALDLALKGAGERVIELSAKAPVRMDLLAGVVAPRFERDHQLALRWRDLSSAWLGPFLPLPEGVAFDLAGELDFEGSAAQWHSALALRGEATPPGLAAVPLDLRVKADPQAQEVALSATVTPPRPEAADPQAPDPQPVPVEILAKTGVDVRTFLPPPWGRAKPGVAPELDPHTEIWAQVKMPPLDLATLRAYLPPGLHGLEGTLIVDAEAQGTVGDPKVQGGAQVKGGAITVLAMGQRLEDLQVDVGVQGQELVIRTMRFKAGEGTGSARGRASLGAEGLEAALDLTLKKLPVLAPGVPPIKFGSEISLTAKVPTAGDRQVGVRLRKTAVELVELSAKGPKSIPGVAGVVFVDERAKAQRAAEAAQAQAAAQLAAQAQKVRTQVLVDVEDPIWIHGAPVDMSWGGRIRMVMGDETPVVEGALVAKRGFFELLSHRFVIDEGEVTLAEGGAGEPFVRIAATTRTDYAQVTAHIKGAATRPQLTFTAVPPLPEEQILSLLITGTPTPSEGEQRSVQEQAANLLVGFSSPKLERALQDSLGIDRVRLSFGSGGFDNPILSFGKHLTRWLYVEGRYQPNALPDEENQTEVNAEIELAPRWTLESRYGDRGIGGLDVFWQVPLSPPAYSGVGQVE